MAATLEDVQRCALCRRHFLQGEAIRLYREPSSRDMRRVCPLCFGNARSRGWELCEATRQAPVQVHADPNRMQDSLSTFRVVGFGPTSSRSDGNSPSSSTSVTSRSVCGTRWPSS